MSEKYRDFAAFEKAGWADAAVSEIYARDFAQASDFASPVLAEAVGAGEGTDALDLCSGQGNVAEALLRSGAAVTGLDFSPAMLAMARARCPDAVFVEGDAGNLPFEEGRFDAVTIGFGIPHVPDPKAVLRESRRVLRRGGRIAFSVWQGPEVDGAFGWVFQAIEAHGDPSISLPPGPGATDFSQPDVAYPALDAAGFEAPELREVDSRWTANAADAPFVFFRDGTVRGRGLLHRQPPECAESIRAAVIERVTGRLGAAGPWTIPMPSVVISATAA